MMGHWTIGLGTGMILGKAAFNSSDKPLFIDAFNPTICCNPAYER